MAAESSSSLMLASLVAGGTAGLVVDVTTYPLDTFKTRIQGKEGFRALGGFSNLYKGVGPVVVGSVPHAALFFCTYDFFKKCAKSVPEVSDPIVHMIGASVGESVALVVGVPVEVVKQRRQVSNKSSKQIIQNIWKTEGCLGLYRGFLTTMCREVPFCFLQMPIWELLKKRWSIAAGRKLEVEESALCGAVGGVIAAAMTTPLDVAKTRIMLSDKQLGTMYVLRTTFKTEGLSGLFAGVLPRTLWMGVGSLIFFGVYEQVKKEFSLTD